MNVEKAINSLRRRGFTASFFASSDEAVSYLSASIKGTEVGIGGSMTVEQLGLYDILSQTNTVHWHWKVPGSDTLKAANSAPVYISSANAISEDGEIINIDGNGNRVSAECFGDKKLYIIAGTNKLAPDFTSALARARNTAAAKNAARFKKKTPCCVDGVCHDCHSPERICKALLVLWAPVNNMDVEVILIDEELGY